MKAARVVNGVVEVHDVPTPEPGHEEVRVRITASGASGMNEAGEFVISAAALQQAGLGALNIMARSVSLGDAGEGGAAASLRLVPGARIDVRALDHVRLNGSLVAQGLTIAGHLGAIPTALGQILHVEGNFSGPGGFSHKPGMWQAEAAERPAGGMTPTGIHALDALIHLLGPVRWVRAISLRQSATVTFSADTREPYLRNITWTPGRRGNAQRRDR